MEQLAAVRGAPVSFSEPEPLHQGMLWMMLRSLSWPRDQLGYLSRPDFRGAVVVRELRRAIGRSPRLSAWQKVLEERKLAWRLARRCRPALEARFSGR